MKKILGLILTGTICIQAFATDDAANVVKDVKQTMSKITPNTQSAVAKKYAAEQVSNDNNQLVALYRPTYVLPYYYTFSPDQAVYRGNTPDNQKIQRQEFKAQFSFKVQLFNNVLNSPTSFNIAYTQLMFWQFYAKSQYFRETNYEPEVFFNTKLMRNWYLSYGVVHQSNGRGGSLERSWNRAYADLTFSGEHWMVSLKPWLLVFKSSSSDLHNKHITKYLGHARGVFAYKFDDGLELSLMLRNEIDSGFRRGAEELDASYPVWRHVSLYVQAFSGYGQSLIEYNHYTNGLGIGISLNNWI
jgi:phospholipase A1/A2